MKIEMFWAIFCVIIMLVTGLRKFSHLTLWQFGYGLDVAELGNQRTQWGVAF
jgi:hypothetical protein